MMLKTVYGPPTEDEERIEDFELEGERHSGRCGRQNFSVNCLSEEKTRGIEYELGCIAHDTGCRA